MEHHGEGSSPGGGRKKRQIRTSTKDMSYERSVAQLSGEGRRTHLVVNRTRRRPLNAMPGSSSTVFDYTCPPYKWLRPGWLAEERRMILSNRLYRYYYDPMGQMYNTRQELEQIWADIDKCVDRNRDIIVLDE